jgi:hypothetical protein
LKALVSFFLSVSLSSGLSSPALVEIAPILENKFANCAALNKVYPGGVAKSSKVKNQGGKTRHQPRVDQKIYEANKSKDRDKDGIACER